MIQPEFFLFVKNQQRIRLFQNNIPLNDINLIHSNIHNT
jgi:hypothetical protein